MNMNEHNLNDKIKKIYRETHDSANGVFSPERYMKKMLNLIKAQVDEAVKQERERIRDRLRDIEELWYSGEFTEIDEGNLYKIIFQRFQEEVQ